MKDEAKIRNMGYFLNEGAIYTEVALAHLQDSSYRIFIYFSMFQQKMILLLE